MHLYYWIMIGITVLWASLCIKGRTQFKDRIFLIISFAVLAFLSGARYNIGIDYSYIYAPQYEQVLANPGYSPADTRFEAGFVYLEKLIASFSQNYQMLFMVTGVLTIALFFVYYWFNAGNPYVAVMLFLTLSQFYCTMNFIRQSIAAIIVTVAMPLLKQKKILHYLLYAGIVLFAALFHKSALIMLIFIFVNLLPVQNVFVLSAYIVGTVVCYLNVGQIYNFVTQYWYSGYGNEAEANVFFEPHFAIAMFIVFLLFLIGSRNLTREKPENYIYVNYAFFNFFFILMGTKHHILDRFTMYFAFAIPIGFSILIDILSKEYKEESNETIFREGILKISRSKAKYLSLIFILFAGSLMLHSYALYMDHHGVKNYQTIWQQPFYKPYKEWLAETKDQQISNLLPDSDEEPVLE